MLQAEENPTDSNKALINLDQAVVVALWESRHSLNQDDLPNEQGNAAPLHHWSTQSVHLK
jgi:hypothetical protein